jgi:hypothetical protein
MAFNIIFLFMTLTTVVNAEPGPLQNKKSALQFEVDLVQQSPATFYLVIHFPVGETHLKSDANLLRTCKILGVFGTLPTQTQQLSLHTHILPQTSEPKRISRSRPLPLDFAGRLSRGPKHRSRLYFVPSFIIQSVDLPIPHKMPGVQLSNRDIKALASAIDKHTPAILLPQNPMTPGLPR